jgi:probable rRNA maturation factor
MVAVIVIRKKVAGLGEGSLSRFAGRAVAAAGLAGEVNVLITGNRELQRLNRRFRHKNAPTDVLSFAAGGTFKKLAGDIAISADIAAANASKLGHSAVEEIKILLLHGLLHLAGYDHERDNGTMAKKEAQLRHAFGLPVTLLERQVSGRQVRAKRPKKSRGT